MIDKKYQIFISSTYTDLIEPRQKVIESILKQYHFPIGMEMFSAADDEQWDIIKETIESSDFYILLIGSRYGSLTTQGIGYTEKEYDYATEIGVPILTFLKDDTLATTPQERETDPIKIQKLQNFREKVQDNKMREVWKNSDDLAHRVSMALMKEFTRKNRVGWIRGDSISEDASKELLALSRENRELKEALSKLEALTNSRKPELELIINNNSLLNISIPDTDWSDIFIDTPEELSLEIPEHLAYFVTLEDIEKYNKALPSEQKIHEYNQNIKLYFLSKFALILEILIKNSGNFKANNVSVEIKFPNFVKLSKNTSLKKILFPKDVLPNNPIRKAESEYEASLKNTFSGLGVARYSDRNYISNIRRDLDIVRIAGSVNQNSIYIVQNNTLTVSLPSLLHTRSISISNEVSIIPLEEGTGHIEVNMICEEMEVLETMVVPITVKNNKELTFNLKL